MRAREDLVKEIEVSQMDEECVNWIETEDGIV